MALADNIHVVLFDLGGVLVELTGVPTMLAWVGDSVSPEALWDMWLNSPAVRAFETGRTTPEVFADDLIAEMALPVGRKHLLDEFTRWPQGLFPGALDLLDDIPPRYTRATLSNANVLHWSRLMEEMGLANAFEYHFASHLTGKIKPDEAAFHDVTKALGCAAHEVLFLDDNRLNVEAAKKCGMNAFRVEGVTEARVVLVETGVMES